MREVLFLAWKNLFNAGKLAGRVRSSIIAIAIGIIPFVVVFYISDGMINGLTGKLIETTTYHMQAISFSDSADMESAAKRLSDTGFFAFPEIDGVGLVLSENGRTGVTVKGIPNDVYKNDKGLQDAIRIESGTFELVGNNAVIGVEVARQLGLTTGDNLKLLTTRKFGKNKLLPRISIFRVVGVISTGYQDVDKLWIYVPYEKAVRLFDKDSSRQIVGIKTDDPFYITQRVKDNVSKLLGRGWFVLTWKELGKAQFISFSTSRAILLFIMAFLAIIAALSISSSLAMLVIERAEEISMLKVMGTHPADISKAYFLSGIFIGVAGAGIGLLIGLFISININNIFVMIQKLINFFSTLFFVLQGREVRLSNFFSSDFYLDYIPVNIDYTSVFVILLSGFMLSFLSSYFPAKKVMVLKPVEILRRE
ncbi:ABC transporter permease [Spirochaetia bacterium 38H-sp]|uniref:ABC transporter permease n=1 Tax=Rarispira pelagica TaxID=3141764 RepID=A0ABU9UE26_9SPIR